MFGVPLVLLQQRDEGAGLIWNLISLVLVIATLVGGWKMFTKAGKPGWGIIIPIYNLYLMCKIAGRSGWWVILLLIPLVNIIFYILLMLDLGRSFGKGVVWSIFLLIIFNFIGVLILGFGDDPYLGPGGQGAVGGGQAGSWQSMGPGTGPAPTT